MYFFLKGKYYIYSITSLAFICDVPWPQRGKNVLVTPGHSLLWHVKPIAIISDLRCAEVEQVVKTLLR